MAVPDKPTNPNDNKPVLVLHVDDDPQLRDLVATYLERLNDDLSVCTDATAADGLETLTTEPIDCIISDYQMPGMNGLEFLEAAKKEYPNLPFILYTGKGSEEIASKATTAGVSAYLQKGGTETYELLVNQITNLTNRRRAERRAKIARDQLLGVFEQVDGFFAIDANWTITYWNQKMATRTGRSADEIVGESFWDAFPAADETDLGNYYRDVQARGEPTEFETYYDPHEYWVRVRAYPMSGGLFIHSQLISDEIEREQELQWRNERLETFANALSHDLKTPLNVAEGNLELAQETGDTSYLDEVAQAHNRMENLLDELLRTARGEELTAEPTSIESVATNAWSTVDTGNMKLTVESDTVIMAGEVQLRRLFENLYANAGKHGNANAVRVGVLKDGSGFYIEDDGTGVPEAEREKVFASGYSTIGGSPGYGLSIVSRICDAHEWTIIVTNSQSGGARFEVSDLQFPE